MLLQSCLQGCESPPIMITITACRDGSPLRRRHVEAFCGTANSSRLLLLAPPCRLLLHFSFLAFLRAKSGQAEEYGQRQICATY